MQRIDKFGRRIFSNNVWSQLRSIGKKLAELGYIESVNKPNLFYIKMDFGFFFADMRGTEIIPIWDAPVPLLYWSFNYDQPNWKSRRHIKEELLKLENHGIEWRVSSFVADDPLLVNNVMFIDFENLIFEWDDGYCKFCKNDFQSDGSYCSPECEKRYLEEINDAIQKKRLREIREGPLIECCICTMNTKDNPETVFQKHHISYHPEEIVITCLRCHQAIHNTKDYPQFKPKQKRLLPTDIRKLERLAKMELAKRNGTFADLYCSICEKRIKTNHSHTFFCGGKVHINCLKKSKKE